MPIINEALVLAGHKNISSIVTTFDNGGDTGRIRTDERGNLLAMSDYWRSLVSLWKDDKQKELWLSMLKYRDGRGRNFGNSFFRFLAERTGNLSMVDTLFSQLTGARIMGRVVPVSLEPSQLCFETKSGKIYTGEQNLDDLRMSLDKVLKIWLNPEVAGNPEALLAIKEADFIFFCPGTLYGSVLANLLPMGITGAIKKSKAKIILIANLVTTPNESHDYSQQDYGNELVKYLPKRKIDLILMADIYKLPKQKLQKVLHYYELEHSFPVSFKKAGPILTKYLDLASIDEHKNTLRHSSFKLVKLFKNLDQLIKTDSCCN